MSRSRTTNLILALALGACAPAVEDLAPNSESAEAFAPTDPGKLYVWHGPALPKPAAEVLRMFASPRSEDWAQARRMIEAHHAQCAAKEQEFHRRGYTVELRRRFPPAVFELAARAEQDAQARSTLVEWGTVIHSALELRNSSDAVAFERHSQILSRTEMGRELLLGTLIQIIIERPDPRLQALAVGALAGYLDTLQREGRADLAQREVKSLIVLMHRDDLGLDSITMSRLAGVLALAPETSLPWLIQAVESTEEPVFLANTLQALGAIGDSRACNAVLRCLERVDLQGAPSQYLVAARALDALAAIGEHSRLRAPEGGAQRAIAPDLVRRVYRWLAAQPDDEVELQKRGLAALQNLAGQPQRRSLEAWRDF